MEGYPTPNSQRSCWRRALNPWQALGTGSGVSPSVCHPRSLLPGVAARPRTGTPAYLLGLGAAQTGASASGPHTLTAASPACWVPWSYCWPCSQGSPPCPAGHLVCRNWEIYMPSCSHSSATLSEPPSSLPWEMCGWAVGSTPVSHFQVLWDPQLQSSQQPREAKYCGRGGVWADTLGNVYVGHHEADVYALHVHVLTD